MSKSELYRQAVMSGENPREQQESEFKMRERFEKWCLKNIVQYHIGDDSMMDRMRFDIWQAATLAERERCAKVCDEFSGDRWDAYKGRGKYEPMNPGRASEYVRGQSDGAEVCADAIRNGI